MDLQKLISVLKHLKQTPKSSTSDRQPIYDQIRSELTPLRETVDRFQYMKSEYGCHNTDMDGVVVALTDMVRTWSPASCLYPALLDFMASDRVLSELERWHELQLQQDRKEMLNEKGQTPLWSKPMSKSRMMAALKIYSQDTFNSFANRYGLRTINRKTHQIRIDQMSTTDREKLERA